MDKRMTATMIGAGIAAYGAWRAIRAWQSRGQDHHTTGGLTQAGERDDEMEASEESFPASDPPARTVTTGPLAG